MLFLPKKSTVYSLSRSGLKTRPPQKNGLGACLQPTKPKWNEFQNIVQDSRGRILGRYKSVGRDLLRSETEYVKRFLIALKINNGNQEKETEDMSRQPQQQKPAPATGADPVNMVFLAGIVQASKLDTESGYILLDVNNENQKYIFCQTREKELLAKLARFEQNDYIKLKGYVRAWSQLKDGKWRNGMDVAITEISNEPPKRAQRQPAPRQAASTGGYDDDIPF